MNRLFELVLLLIDHKKMTTKQIADYFEISQRTVLRDLDKLLVAGIPIETNQGYQGGVSIAKTYRLAIDFMSKQEKEALVVGLSALDSVQENPLLPIVTRKIFQHVPDELPAMTIDLSSWYGTSLKPKIELIKDCISQQHKVSFVYYSESGDKEKKVSPYQLVFKWGNWYLRGICEENQDFRLYKLNRMDQLEIVAERSHSFLVEEAETVEYFEQINFQIHARFSKKVKAQLIDDFGKSSFVEKEEGLYFKQGFTDKRYLIRWLLGFGAEVEILEPKEIRNELKEISQAMNKLYQYDS